LIKTFRHKGLATLFETGNARKVQPKHAKRLTLRGGRYSVWADENYRVTFRFDGGHAYEVDYEDYH